MQNGDVCEQSHSYLQVDYAQGRSQMDMKFTGFGQCVSRPNGTDICKEMQQRYGTLLATEVYELNGTVAWTRLC